MTQNAHGNPALALQMARQLINERLWELRLPLRDEISLPLHDNPELAYKEFFAHDLIVKYLESLGFQTRRSTWNLETSFEALYGDGGRQVVFCAEYDALPEIGHACGHNLIACSSVGAFLGAAHAMATLGIHGRLRLLGTPAEEGLCGKAALIEAGAFNPPKDIAAAIMAHAIPASLMKFGSETSGIAGFKFSACHILIVEFTGQAAHAAGEPWKGINALDAAVAAYTNISLLRQQMIPNERVHGVIEHGGTVPGIITDYSRTRWYVRAPTTRQADALLKRVRACIEAASTATGCKVNFQTSPSFMNMRANSTLCDAYVEDMASFGVNVVKDGETTPASTDMGNVLYVVPSFHGGFVIPADATTTLHTPAFAAAARTEAAHDSAMQAAKGMAMMAIRVLVDDNIAAAARVDFEKDED